MRVEKAKVARLLGVAPTEDEQTAAAVLGLEHALPRLLTRRRTLTCQIVVTSIALVLAVAAVALRRDEALAVLVAAATVELALLAAVPYFRGRTREVTQELIATGKHEAFAVPAVRDEGRRLASRKERERFARSLERLVHDAERWYRILPAYRPPDGAQVLRHAAAEAREVVALLRAERAHVRGVALTARFLMDGYSSPLYAGDVRRLREELNRIRYLLTPDNTPHTVRAAA